LFPVTRLSNGIFASSGLHSSQPSTCRSSFAERRGVNEDDALLFGGRVEEGRGVIIAYLWRISAGEPATLSEVNPVRGTIFVYVRNSRKQRFHVWCGHIASIPLAAMHEDISAIKGLSDGKPIVCHLGQSSSVLKMLQFSPPKGLVSIKTKYSFQTLPYIRV